ncbi:MAG TPA: hypothetical protein VK911_06490 [Vicinamibacterales bacterium]|nr:hypothetical protein [Vicinamibacterales bacterium]
MVGIMDDSGAARTDDGGRAPAAAYRRAAARHRAGQQRLAGRSRRISMARVAVFLAAAALVLAALPGGGAVSELGITAGAAGFLAFFALVYWHSRVDAAERRASAFVATHEEAAARVERRWADLPPPRPSPAEPHHPYAEDLDLFGRASLFTLLGSAGTEAGRQALGRWLLEGAAPAEIRARQEAVRELAGRAEWRELLAATARLVEANPHELDVFLAWAASPPWLAARPGLLWTARAASASTVLLALLHLLGAIPHPFWIYPLIVAVGLMAAYERRIHHRFSQAFSRERIFHEHAALFAHLAGSRFASPRLRQLVAQLHTSGLSAPEEMAALGRLMRLADLRFQALFHFLINVLTLWDFHVLDALERWQARAGSHLRQWFDALGEAEALAALAWLAHDNPSWAFPVVEEAAGRLTAEALGHPLLPDHQRVANDVEVGPRGTCLLVTGSNMSGKSTLLRAIGVNVVLAQAGGVVCARRLVMPPVAPFTSMRVQDSLAEGVSYFMAALRRLRLLVTEAERAREQAAPLLYLLDEILQGTNTAERQVAVRRIMAHLLGLPAIGAVTTHDLELANAPELADRCRPVHFTEGVATEGEGVKLSFDYRLRPGVATSRNALKLLQLMGLDAPAEHR